MYIAIHDLNHFIHKASLYEVVSQAKLMQGGVAMFLKRMCAPFKEMCDHVFVIIASSSLN